jgi:hypothetical protein
MKQDLDTLKSMLAYRRPSGGPTEAEFIRDFLAPLGVVDDVHGNRYIIVGDEAPTVLWSSHTDSVHKDEGFQDVAFDGRAFRLPEFSRSNCLGADDAAGVWIMIEMIKAKVPGLYVFHFGEEIGCVGSSAIATYKRQFLEGIQAAIAFDRRGHASVITHQGDRCCSDSFGKSLAQQLPKRFKLDKGGILTDTRMYMHLVPECSNVSVGYYNEHSRDECLFLDHIRELRDHMVSIDASKLLIERDPKVMPIVKKKKKQVYNGFGFGSAIYKRTPETLSDLLWRKPDECADALEQIGITFDDLREMISYPAEDLLAS